jgi:hypothetical protein
MADRNRDARYETTRLAAIDAFEGPGLPTNAFPDIADAALADYVAELALNYVNALPRHLRRHHRELLLDAFVRTLGRGFWAGAAFIVKRDQS